MLGYVAVMPNLYSREAPGARPDDAAALVRAQGGVPDDRLVGDVGGAAAYLRALPNTNGKVGVIGYCSGGRQSFLAATSLPLDAAVDCYGAFVVGAVPEGMPLKAGPIVDRAPQLNCPLLGLFGLDDQYPSPEQVLELQQASGGGRQDRMSSTATQTQATGSSPPTGRVIDPPPLPKAGSASRTSSHATWEPEMCTYITKTLAASGSAKGQPEWFDVTDVSVYFDHPVHAQAGHTVNIDLRNPVLGPSARVAAELTADSARALAHAILAILDEAPAGLT